MNNQDTAIRFNQNNLQDYLDCPRRFELKHIQNLDWPAAISSPPDAFERYVEIGNRFHLICQQHFEGLPTEQIEGSITDPDLLDLWNSFKRDSGLFQGELLLTEQLVQAGFNSQVLTAKYDLIIKSKDRIWIVDWKTSHKKLPLSVLKNRVQTLLYPFLFTLAGSNIFGISEIDPSQVLFSYWYPLTSDPEIQFRYSQDEHQRVKEFLTDLLNEITDMIAGGEEFTLTDDFDTCLACPYRSICDRGNNPGPLKDELVQDSDLNSDLTLDLEQIAEIDF